MALYWGIAKGTLELGSPPVGVTTCIFTLFPLQSLVCKRGGSSECVSYSWVNSQGSVVKHSPIKKAKMPMADNGRRNTSRSIPLRVRKLSLPSAM